MKFLQEAEKMEIPGILDQLERAFRRDAWCGPSLLEALAGVDADRAAARPLQNAHTIWEIVLHLAAWKDTVRRRIEGQPVVLPMEGDWPLVGSTDQDEWKSTLTRIAARHEELIATVRGLQDEALGTILISEQTRESGGGVSCYVTLHGVAQHDLYHAGQIMLLKKNTGG